ncbi:hypothetical protein QJS83_11840 [Bdellovibrio sp. 22V]|uniref:hypothetical protein n=1 Tax=Bdellovibrio sp. 22V TaxID=3044166 RepID=UPI002543EBE2|nr:hypothetical protein [Bdellovibrio sp. 22V]WII71151.1 hypothetical protein QJS83_11840 [Bdellovibrio sp. 22V]
MKKGWLLKGFIASMIFAQEFSWAQNKTVQRPPQFVLFAFDGSYNNEVWQYSRDFTKQLKQKGVDTRFTYFINPVYLLTPETSSNYQPPGYRLETRKGEVVTVRNRGSAIGWGDDNQDIGIRIDHMNDAYREGHEIGSHAVGHFDGGYKECHIDPATRKCQRDGSGGILWKWNLAWSEADWRSEFEQFYNIVENVFRLNDLRSVKMKSRKWLFGKEDIKGFRAPVLGVSEGLWSNLPKFGISYDTSKVNRETYWPQRNEYGTWNFPLAEIQEPGGARRWISMDYNFCVRDSARVLSEEPQTMALTVFDAKKNQEVKANKNRACLNMVSPAQKAKVKKNMMTLYRSYFEKNYYGNRAPVHIGHHFSQWMSGAYYEVFYEFAKEVCAKPEVKCGTYAELMNFVETKSPAQLEAYKNGAFVKMSRPKSAAIAHHWDLQIDMTADAQAMKFVLTGVDAERTGLKPKATVNGVSVSESLVVQLDDVRKAAQGDKDALVRMAISDRHGKEVATATYKIFAIGSENEAVLAENLEERWVQGHLPEAHADEMDFSKGH